MYLCIDLKSFYASVELRKRNLDVMRYNLVVADTSRGKNALCLAVSPSLKTMGVKNRCRLSEIPKNINYIIAKPKMKDYINKSCDIYDIYLKFFSKEDIYVYSIDECFIYIKPYLKLYKKTEIELAKMIVSEVYKLEGLVVTAGIGENMFLAKIAMDIIAKKNKDFIGYINDKIFNEEIIYHEPLSDFWQIGINIEKRLNMFNIYNLYDVRNTKKELLDKIIGVDSTNLLNHANGIEKTTIKEIHEYNKSSKSISNSQILFSDYNYFDSLIILKEMCYTLTLKLIRLNLSTKEVSLSIRYKDNTGFLKTKVLDKNTNSYETLVFELLDLAKLINEKLIRGIGISFKRLSSNVYYDLFDDETKLKKEENLLRVVNSIKDEFGKNSILLGINLLDRSTQKMRNNLIGGHNE